MAGGGGGGGLDFKSTPSWVIGSAVFMIVVISLFIKKFLSYLGKLLKRKEKKPLNLALKKIKEELMLLGFISLLLTVFGDKIHTKCIPEKLARKWLPCHDAVPPGLITGGKRRLLAGSSEPNCDQGKVPFISSGVLHDVHYLIFILAVVHVLSCILIVLLGEMKIFQWRKWEDAIRMQIDADYSNNCRVLDVRSLSFIKDRLDVMCFIYITFCLQISFFKHLAGIVTKADYTAMRTGFILDGIYILRLHLSPLLQVLIDKAISITQSFIMFSLTSSWHQTGTSDHRASYLYSSKAYCCFRRTKNSTTDDYFWFNKPRIVLLLIHTILFINSFGFAIYFWTWFKFDLHSCEMGKTIFALPRIILMLLVQTICSYRTNFTALCCCHTDGKFIQ